MSAAPIPSSSPVIACARRHLQTAAASVLLGFAALLVGCASSSSQGSGVFGSNRPATASGQNAAARAESSTYRPAEYVNAARKGPRVIVLPGEIKSAHTSFRISPNNIADFGELELGRANFTVLERAALGSMVREMQTAYALGNEAQARRLFDRGQLQSTRWIVKFDVLKAEPVTESSSGFDGSTVGKVIDIVAGGSKAGQLGGVAADSTRTAEQAKAWLIGMRYKILDAATTEQVATGYFEERMSTSRQSSSFLGIKSGSADLVTLDTMVQYLVQKCVTEVDARHK
ncbi:hypothetical protein [Sphaerotilus microaerophilus]|uniref:Lipoprotein n=1 Tax=Sphaerotilus microaerophilus TaxID=2914710 RepID=A0ABN6PNI7_9BURK|nr:hypothetical protein [Sphaerotilus sp. FB-5]BDI04845.1 hypothetical protein CATMQ487_18150 [Sphaerotilus sp. FB-5]